ncbi:MAG: hypothetical protein IJ423_01810 [Clostridia bacterium]|nr:hypothetical protein [Clostridia bacterium]
MKLRLVRIVLCVLLALTVLLPSVCFADYGSTIPASAVGTKFDILTIKRPESLSASTSDKTYTISATGAQGTRVKVYKLDTVNNIGKLVTPERAIGASGLYSTVVDLSNDSNTFIVYAENSTGSQIVNISINKIKKSTIDRLKSLTVTIKNFLG